jgi:hypothetical protein
MKCDDGNDEWRGTDGQLDLALLPYCLTASTPDIEGYKQLPLLD